jgi:hypothetical protein
MPSAAPWPFGSKLASPAGSKLSVISIVARPGDRREGEDLVVIKQSDIIAITAS